MLYTLANRNFSSTTGNLQNAIVSGEAVKDINRDLTNMSFINCHFDGKVKVGHVLAGRFIKCTFNGANIEDMSYAFKATKETGDFDFKEHVIIASKDTPVYKIVKGQGGLYYFVYGHIPARYTIINPVDGNQGKIRTDCFVVDNIYKLSCTSRSISIDETVTTVKSQCMGGGESIDYRKGYAIKPVKPLDCNFTITCASGIHCFFTKEEAANLLYELCSSYKQDKLLAVLP